jgi:hypothetical protein
MRAQALRAKTARDVDIPARPGAHLEPRRFGRRIRPANRRCAHRITRGGHWQAHLQHLPDVVARRRRALRARWGGRARRLRARARTRRRAGWSVIDVQCTTPTPAGPSAPMRMRTGGPARLVQCHSPHIYFRPVRRARARACAGAGASEAACNIWYTCGGPRAEKRRSRREETKRNEGREVATRGAGVGRASARRSASAGRPSGGAERSSAGARRGACIGSERCEESDERASGRASEGAGGAGNRAKTARGGST